MKALTLTQPWASLMALQAKRIETRSWFTTYRGDLVIHAAKGFPRWARDACYEPEFAKALGMSDRDLPLSRGLCVVKLLACVPTDKMHQVEAVLGHKPSTQELEFGDYSECRFAWVTEFVRPLLSEPVKGALGLWNWEE